MRPRRFSVSFHRERLADPLRSERWQRDGHGLGLHIAHEIVLEHAGSMEVMSDGLRTVVRVRLPKRRELAGEVERTGRMAAVL